MALPVPAAFALSEDKTHAFYLLIDGALREIMEAMKTDIIDTIWRLNGWPEELIPEVTPEAVRFNDVEQVAASLQSLATAGATLAIDDPAINDVRDLLGISQQDDEIVQREMRDAELNTQFERGTMPGTDPSRNNPGGDRMKEKPSIHDLELMMENGVNLEISPDGTVHERDIPKEEKAKQFLSELQELKGSGDHY